MNDEPRTDEQIRRDLEFLADEDTWAMAERHAAMERLAGDVAGLLVRTESAEATAATRLSMFRASRRHAGKAEARANDIVAQIRGAQ